MAKYKLTKPYFSGSKLYGEGEVVDFGDSPAPKDAVKVGSPILEKAKQNAEKATDTQKEDKLLKADSK